MLWWQGHESSCIELWCWLFVQNTTTRHDKASKVEMMQKKLSSLLHARNCKGNCTNTLCPQMKNILAHLDKCVAGKDCPGGLLSVNLVNSKSINNLTFHIHGQIIFLVTTTHARTRDVCTVSVEVNMILYDFVASSNQLINEVRYELKMYEWQDELRNNNENVRGDLECL